MFLVAVTTKRIAIMTLIDYLTRKYSAAPSVQLEIRLTALLTTTLSCESQTFVFHHHHGARIVASHETQKDTNQHNGQRTRYASEDNARRSWTESPLNTIDMNREHIHSKNKAKNMVGNCPVTPLAANQTHHHRVAP